MDRHHHTFAIPSRSPRPVRRVSFLALVLAGALAAGCGHKIGDACGNSADCDPTGGTRTCDLSQPGGYCIVDGCDARSCPDDSVCGRFFPDQQFATSPVSCDPAATPSGCMADEVCVSDANLKAPTTATCVRASLERRACVQSCGGDGDCRGGYICRPFNICGAIPLILDPRSTPKFCAPAPPPSAAGASLCPLT